KTEDSRLPDLMKSTKEIVDPMPEKLKSVLVNEIATNGAVKAIEVCSIKAPAMAKAASEKTGWEIKRVSLKNRNPKGSADKWETRAIKDFEQKLAVNSDAAMEKGEIVTIKGKHYFRFAKGLKTVKECLLCHGKEENIATEIKEKLKEVYPKDRATGYEINQVRGILSVTRAIN
ncbi:Tll0287-like domain-containing protein, partial [Chlorobium ferrooxidans]